jgi:autotransporter-associated beta strand protein
VTLGGLNGSSATTGTPVTVTLGNAALTGVTYQWLDNGAAISGATGSSYTPVASDIGKVLDVLVSFNDPTTGAAEHVSALAGTVLSAYVVTSTADTTAAGTLRSAIAFANANPGTDITFSNAIANQTITLTSELPLILGNNTVIDGGANHITVSGNNTYRDFFVGNTSSTLSVTIENLTLANAVAKGGSGADGGGGGAGLGGAIFVSSNASLALDNVSLVSDSAIGGAGGAGPSDAGGGGGGMGGNGGIGGAPGTDDGGGGGGGFGVGANGGGVASSGSAGAFTNGTSGGSDYGASGGANGGGGAGGPHYVNGSQLGSGAGGGIGGSSPTVNPVDSRYLLNGGNGGFGGGGGGAEPSGNVPAGDGGYGGGGGSVNSSGSSSSGGGYGGFGGGGGAHNIGGFAGGNGAGGGGAGGAGLGGAIFVMTGGSLTVAGTLAINSDTASGGAGAGSSSGGGSFGSGIFYQGTDGTTSTLSFGAGNQVVSNVIADYSGSGGIDPSGGTNVADQGGNLALIKTGGGTLILSAANTYTGSTTVAAGTLEVDGSIASSVVTVQSGATLDGSGATGIVTVQSGGIIDVQDDTLSLAGLVNSGLVHIESGAALAVNGVSNAFTINNGGELELGGASSEQVTFQSSSTGTLRLDQPQNFTGTVTGFGAGDTIDLSNVTHSSGEYAVWTQSSTASGGNGTLAIYNAAGTLQETLNLNGIYNQGNFSLVEDSTGTHGTDVLGSLVVGPAVTGTATAFATMDYPGGYEASGQGTFAYGINNAGDVVGFTYSGSINNTIGFEYGGSWSAINDAGAQDNDANGINNSGEIVGFYSPQRSTPRYGFTDVNGTFTPVVSDSPYPSTTVNGVNDSGVMVGSDYLHTAGSVTPEYSGFIDNGGTFTYLNAPGTLIPTGYTYAEGINDSGAVVGVFSLNNGADPDGFLYQGGTYTIVTDPNGTEGTAANGINNEGVIVGYYVDSSGKDHGFVDIGGAFTTVDDPLGTNTTVTGINDAGQIVGYYQDSSGIYHAFTASLNGISTNEDHALTLTTLSVSDVNAGSNPISVTINAGHGDLTLNSTTNLTVSGQGTDALTFSGSTAAIDAALADGLVYTPTLGFDFTDALAVTASDSGNNASDTPITSTQDIGIIVDPAVQIAGGATYEVSAASSGTVKFDAATGTLQLDSPSTFTGEIAGISGSGDKIDLHGMNAATDTVTAATGIGSFDSTTDTTVLTVTDHTNSRSVSLTLAGDYSGSFWTVSSDGGTGADIVDPPASNSPTAPSVDSFATANDVHGTITFADTDTSNTQTAAFTPEGSNYLGTFSVAPVTESNGNASANYGFSLGHDQINLADGQTATQSYELSVTDPHNPAVNMSQTVSISLGGAGNDNFVFAPGVGADTIVNFNPQQDTIELDHFANVQTVQQLAAAITPDTHGDAVIDLGHHDSITVAGVTPAQLQAVLQSVVHLH